MARDSKAESVSLISLRVCFWLNPSVTFINILDPYADMPTPDIEERPLSPELSPDVQQHDGWELENRLKTPSMDCYRLEALSAAALYSIPEANGGCQPVSMGILNLQSPTQLRSPVRDTLGQSMSSSSSMASSHNNLNFLLNPTSHVSPTIDPSLQGTYSNGGQPFSSPKDSTSSPSVLQDLRPKLAVETKHEVAFLLRYFSETPGHWCVSW